MTAIRTRRPKPQPDPAMILAERLTEIMTRQTRIRIRPPRGPDESLVGLSKNPIPGGPELGRAIPDIPTNGLMDQTHPLVGATVPKVASILRESERGYMGRCMDLYDDMLERDGHLQAVQGSRINALVKQPWEIRPPKSFANDARALDVASKVQSIFDEIEEWPTVEAHGADGIMRSYSVIEMEWGMNARGWWVPIAFYWLHPNRFNFDQGMRPLVYDRGVHEYPGKALSEFGRDKFIVHAPVTRSAYVTRRGILRSCIFPVLTKRFGLQWWLTGVERWGTPGMYGEIPEGSEGIRDEILAAIKKFQQDWAVVMTAGATLHEVPNAGTFTGEAHAKLCQVSDYQVSKAVLGQVATTDPVAVGLGSGLPKVQDDVRLDIAVFDAIQWSMSVRRDMIRAIVRANWPGEVVPCYHKTQEERAEIIPAHYIQVPRAFTVNELRATVRQPPRPDGDRDIVPPPVQPGGFGAPATSPGPQPPAPPQGYEAEGDLVTADDASPFALTANEDPRTSNRWRLITKQALSRQSVE